MRSRSQVPLRRRLILWLAPLLFLTPALGLSPARAATSPLASNRLVFDSNRTGNYQIFSMGFDGSSPRQLTFGSQYDSWWPRLSPDRTQVIFYRSPVGVHDRDFTKTSLWEMNADGSNVHRLIANGAYGWTLQGHAMWSPDGTRLAMFAGSSSNPQIWVTDANGGNARQVTARPGTNVDPSWDPSGNALLFIGCPQAVCTGSSYEIYRISLTGAGLTRLTNDLARDQDPASSPDGSRIAWLRQTTTPTWGVYLMNRDGTDQHGLVSGLAVNSRPAWSDDGQWIFFHRESSGQTAYGIWRVHPDGSGLAEIDGHAAVGPSPWADEYPDAGLY